MRMLLSVVFLLTLTSTADAGKVCPQPRTGLVRGTPSVDAQSLSFTSDQKLYKLDIYSGFAPQSRAAGSPWCLRYEIENVGVDPVSLLYWPLGPLYSNPLPPSKRDSVVVTRSSTNQPSIADTVLFAGKSSAMRSRAYQASIQLANQMVALSPPEPLPVASRDLPVLGGTAGQQRLGSLPLLLATERITVREPRELPVIGAEFDDYAGSTSVASQAFFDGKSYSITLGIQTHLSLKQMRAPYLRLLSSSQSPEELLTRLRQPEELRAPLPSQQSYDAKATFSVEQVPLRLLYVIEHPIAIERGEGSVCFLAPAYAPVPIPPSMLSCGLVLAR